MIVEQTNAVDEWVAILGKEHMPALAATVQNLNKLTSDDDARVSQLTEQILKDPSLTSRVLQIANSAVYKGFGGNIKTITYAIVMLGFTTIRDISLSMQIIDNILKKNSSTHLMTQIANSFHAAMQARSMLHGVKTPAQEEIFISTLLLHFADLSILSRTDEASKELNSLLTNEGCSANEAAKKVLGCSFSQISLALAKQWDLGALLIEALKNPSRPSKPAQAVLLGDELSQVANLGWNSEAVKQVVKKIAKYRDVSFGDALAEVKQTADLAQSLAVHYGAAKVRHLIPSSHVSAPESDDSPITSTETVANSSPGLVQKEAEQRAAAVGDEGRQGGSSSRSTKAGGDSAKVGDVQLQMEIMQRLNVLIAEKRMDVNAMLGLVMEGMCDALGLDRVVMALVSKDRKKLVPKLFKGQVDEEFKNKFHIQFNEENAFTTAVMMSQQLWMGSKLMAGRGHLHTPQVQQVLNCNEYFVAPIIVSRKPIGVFYGDQSVTGAALNEQQYAGFSMLAQQAGMAISANQT